MTGKTDSVIVAAILGAVVLGVFFHLDLFRTMLTGAGLWVLLLILSVIYHFYKNWKDKKGGF